MENYDKILFSIIIPVYNSAGMLLQNLISIAHQSYSDYEIIFVDGGSTDETLKIVHSFKIANGHIRTKLLSEPDKGIYDAMNKGLDLAVGDWLYFMGCDDRFCSSSVLAQVASEIGNEGLDLVYGNVEGAVSGTRYIYNTLSKVLSVGIHHQSVFYRSYLFNDLGKYDLRFKIASDYHFTLKVFLNNHYKTKYVDLDIAYYGEDGYSSRHFDYKLFSGHYRLLAKANQIAELEDQQKCLNDSVYYCLHLALRKKNLLTAWSNLLFYIFNIKEMTLSQRCKTAYTMLVRTIRPFADNDL
jgi:glycosyltransferase involved in cell wall biosynthesis